jgi:hypothetical protein
LNALVDEQKLAAAHDDPNADRKIIITGGLPPIPGCDVIIAQLNMVHSQELLDRKHFELEANKDPINHATDYASDHSVPEPPPPDPNKP